MVHVDGKILVQGNISRSFEVEPLTDGTGYSKIIWKDTQNDAYFSGGSLGALVELRDVDIRNEIQGLNTMTMNFADLVNDIHRNAVGANNTTDGTIRFDGYGIAIVTNAAASTILD